MIRVPTFPREVNRVFSPLGQSERVGVFVFRIYVEKMSHPKVDEKMSHHTLSKVSAIFFGASDVLNFTPIVITCDTPAAFARAKTAGKSSASWG